MPDWSDRDTSLTEVRAALQAFNGARDWGQYHTPRNLAMALSAEAGELLELYLWSADDGPQPPVPERLPRVAEEAADVAICLLNLCDAAGIDLLAAVQAKLASNGRRYPVATARGSNRKAGELPQSE